MTQNLIIVRGLPGSGKSTFGKMLANINYDPETGYVDWFHVEADQYFTDNNGNYNFDATKLAGAHNYCYETTLNCIKCDHNVVVTNTFTRKWEYEKYLNIPYLLPDRDIRVTVITMDGNYKNIHGVPDEVIDNMRKRWEY